MKKIKRLSVNAESIRVLRTLPNADGGWGLCSNGVPSNPATACQTAQGAVTCTFTCEVLCTSSV